MRLVIICFQGINILLKFHYFSLGKIIFAADFKNALKNGFTRNIFDCIAGVFECLYDICMVWTLLEFNL